jgi:hypothetical protein
VRLEYPCDRAALIAGHGGAVPLEASERTNRSPGKFECSLVKTDPLPKQGNNNKLAQWGCYVLSESAKIVSSISAFRLFYFFGPNTSALKRNYKANGETPPVTSYSLFFLGEVGSKTPKRLLNKKAMSIHLSKH